MLEPFQQVPFLSVFSANCSFNCLKNSPYDQRSRHMQHGNVQKIFTFIFCGAKPMVFHSLLIKQWSPWCVSPNQQKTYSLVLQVLQPFRRVQSSLLDSLLCACSECFEVLLVTLVDNSAGCLKRCPNLLTKFLSNRTCLTIFLMKFPVTGGMHW